MYMKLRDTKIVDTQVVEYLTPEQKHLELEQNLG